jgi:hypothetical protein
MENSNAHRYIFGNGVEVHPEPDRYSAAMSSVPGIYLHINGQVEGGAILRYECESGRFGLLEDGIITELGSYAERGLGVAPSVHWSPDASSKDGDTIRISLVKDGNTADYVTFTVQTDDMLFYELSRNPSAGEYEIPTESGVMAEILQTFVSQMHKVQLVAPREAAARSIREHYSDYLTPELLEEWAANSEAALGKTTSSPWPDRIEMLKYDKISTDKCTVYGKIIWITSVEAENGGAAGVDFITLRFDGTAGTWKISGVDRDVSEDIIPASI